MLHKAWRQRACKTARMRVAGSTTAEGACESVRLACQQLVDNTLAPMADEMREEVQKKQTAEEFWKAVIQGAANPMHFPNKQLTAYALFDGSRRDKPAGRPLLLPPACVISTWVAPYLMVSLLSGVAVMAAWALVQQPMLHATTHRQCQ